MPTLASRYQRLGGEHTVKPATNDQRLTRGLSNRPWPRPPDPGGGNNPPPGDPAPKAAEK
jgi:hypothetical protein